MLSQSTLSFKLSRGDTGTSQGSSRQKKNVDIMETAGFPLLCWEEASSLFLHQHRVQVMLCSTNLGRGQGRKRSWMASWGREQETRPTTRWSIVILCIRDEPHAL